MRTRGAGIGIIFWLFCMGSVLTLGQQPDAAVAARIDVQPEELQHIVAGANWPTYNGDYTGRRFSPLSGITSANVGRLRAAWVFHSPNSTSLEVSPVVVNGVMFISSANDAFALDARTGRQLWHYSRPVSQGLIDDASSHHSRGVAVWHSRVFIETDNAHLLCLDARSGHLIWDVAFADSALNYGATSVPLIVKDHVIVGPSGGDDGTRGFIAAYDARTGKLDWKFWTIPGPGEPGFASWGTKNYPHGGGTAWMPGTYDPETNTLFWGTGNPDPDFDGSTRPGDDLYTDSVLALDPDSGQLKWHFQFTPHDLYDYDSTETPVLIDAVFHHQPRKLLVEANRNGFLYALDRTTGQFLGAVPFVTKLNWAQKIDAQGRPVLNHVIPTQAGTRVCPGYEGATNWYSPSYNPQTGLFYLIALERCEIYHAKPAEFVPGQTYYNSGVSGISGESGHKVVLAFRVSDLTEVWRYPQVGDGRSWAGTLSTAGGLLFFGDDAESFEAVDARTGKALWHFNTGQTIHASPVTFSVNAVQYVAIAAGSDVFTFALPD